MWHIFMYTTLKTLEANQNKEEDQSGHREVYIERTRSKKYDLYKCVFDSAGRVKIIEHERSNYRLDGELVSRSYSDYDDDDIKKQVKHHRKKFPNKILKQIKRRADNREWIIKDGLRNSIDTQQYK